MLVLSRKKDECVVINNDIKIVVVEIRGDKVRLGVEAPKEVPVHRSEVYDAINGSVVDAHLESTLSASKRSEICVDSETSHLAAGNQLPSIDGPSMRPSDTIEK